MRSKVLSICLLFTILMSAACTTQAAATPTEAPTEAPSSTPVEERTLTVMAAASLTESYTEIGALFESQNPGVTVTFNFAGTQALVEQLTQGAEADVFASANTKYMNAAVDAGLIAADTAQTFAYNKLVVIYPKDNPAGIAELKDLAKSGLKLDLADSSVPVGQYSLDFLDKAAADAAYGTAYKDAVLSTLFL